MGTFFRCSDTNPRGVTGSNWQWLEGRPANQKKSDKRYQAVDLCCATNDQDFRNAVATTIQQRGEGFRGWYTDIETSQPAPNKHQLEDIPFEVFDQEDPELQQQSDEGDLTLEDQINSETDDPRLDTFGTQSIPDLSEASLLEVHTDYRTWYKQTIMQGGIPLLAKTILDRENDFGYTHPMHHLSLQSAREIITTIFYTVEPEILRALVSGTLPRDVVCSMHVKNAINELASSHIIRPTIYLQSLVTAQTPVHSKSVESLI